MLKTDRSISKKDVQTFLFNAAGIAMVGGLGIYMIQSALVSDEIAKCSERYATSVEMALHATNGRVLTPIEFQANLSGPSQNILENSEITKGEHGSDAVMKVHLREGSHISEIENDKEIFGIKFHWSPSSLQGAKKGCLTYNVFLPENLDFGRYGSLPSFEGSGETTDENGNGQDYSFVAQMGWNPSGFVTLGVSYDQEIDQSHQAPYWQINKALPKGEWVKVEQEFEAKDESSGKGLYRLWLNGDLIFEKFDVTWGPGSVRIGGVKADVGYTYAQKRAVSPETKSAVLEVTPFVMRWQ